MGGCGGGGGRGTAAPLSNGSPKKRSNDTKKAGGILVIPMSPFFWGEPCANLSKVGLCTFRGNVFYFLFLRSLLGARSFEAP